MKWNTGSYQSGHSHIYRRSMFNSARIHRVSLVRSIRTVCPIETKLQWFLVCCSEADVDHLWLVSKDVPAIGTFGLATLNNGNEGNGGDVTRFRAMHMDAN